MEEEKKRTKGGGCCPRCRTPDLPIKTGNTQWCKLMLIPSPQGEGGVGVCGGVRTSEGSCHPGGTLCFTAAQNSAEDFRLPTRAEFATSTLLS